MQKFGSSFGHVEVLEGTEKVGISILVIYPGKEIKPHFHKKTKEVEIVLEGELNSNGKKFKENDVLIWEINKVHGYKNETSKNARVLCITIPPYDESDVFEV
jgi:mannose-6-phosphate isomerase-like protein (cupin superfamily)